MAEMMEPEDKVVNMPVIKNIFWMFQKMEENIMIKREMEHRKKDPNGTSRAENNSI